MRISGITAAIASMTVTSVLVFGAAQAEIIDAEFAKSVLTENAAGVPMKVGPDFTATVVPTIVNINLRDLPVVDPWQPGDPINTIPRLRGKPAIVDPQPVNPVLPGDPLVARQNEYSERGPGTFVTPLVNVEGLNNGSNPHDPNGEIGPDFFVQMINSAVGGGFGSSAIWHNKDGSVNTGPFTLHSLGGSGPCSTGRGDPIAFYDELADRWVLTEFSSSGNRMCFYVAQTNDPINGGWFAYDFAGVSFPDYPKYGAWSDAYYVGTNEASSALYAFERDQMLLGNPAQMVRFSITDPAAFPFAMIPPVDFDGLTPPPANEPGIFIRHFDDEAHDPGNNDPASDLLQIWEFDVDWANTGNSAITGPINVQISEFDSEQCGFSAFQCYPQPNTGTTLDPLREVVMNMPKYRNFGSHETIVGNLTTDVSGNDQGGVRWFELRRMGGGAWSVFQEGTYAPDIDDGAGAVEHRWMAASAMDESGNIAVGFNLSNDTNIFPSLTYDGRLESDPPGVLTAGETTIVDGTGSHTSSTRWGDYSSMSVDPSDGCTFWFTSNYGSSATSPTAATRIASFKFDSCGDPTFTLSGDPTDQQVCVMGDTPLAPVNLTIGSANGFTDPVSLSFNPALPAEITGNISPTMVTPPDSATANLTVLGTATAGDYMATVEGFSAAVGAKTIDINVAVATQAPPAPTLTAPADGALNILPRPTFSWTAAAQANEYLLEVATDSGFTNIILSQMAVGTNFMPNFDLPTSSTLYWRVTPANQCGNGSTSAVFSFTTIAAPGDCSPGSTPRIHFLDDMESGAPGWTSSSDVGPNTWTLTNTTSNSGSFSFNGQDIDSESDQRLVSPAIPVPAVAPALSLQFFTEQEIESDAPSNCWDGGILEISTDGGGIWNQIDNARLQTDPYDGEINDFSGGQNPLFGLDGWCGDPQPWTRSVVDLSGFEGETLNFRFRLGTDGSVGRDGGWSIDDVRVQSCVSGPIYDDSFESGLPPR